MTDDVQALERSNRPVEIVLGSAKNFKVTLPEDFDMCRQLLSPVAKGRGKRAKK
jgi:2-C-methyl-D-erythritol 4-phosphate cytidylyltransferase